MGLNPTRTVLPNGVTVVAKGSHTTPAVSILANVRAGGFADPPGRDGTAALAARMLDRGTRSLPAAAIADDLDGRGASLTVSAGRHQIVVSATCLADDFDAVLALVADILREPVFPESEVTTRRADLISSIRQEEDSPATLAVDAMMRALYGAHPYARKVRGNLESVNQLSRVDLLAFHGAWFQPSAITLVVVGDVDEGWAIDAVTNMYKT